jgi:hypothetical protein
VFKKIQYDKRQIQLYSSLYSASSIPPCSFSVFRNIKFSALYTIFTPFSASINNASYKLQTSEILVFPFRISIPKLRSQWQICNRDLNHHDKHPPPPISDLRLLSGNAQSAANMNSSCTVATSCFRRDRQRSVTTSGVRHEESQFKFTGSDIKYIEKGGREPNNAYWSLVVDKNAILNFVSNIFK